VKGDVEQVPLSEMSGRIVATGVVPYPPGIPLLLPGERAGGDNEPVLLYLLALQNFDARFPGFSHDIHGVECTGGKYRVFCMREDI
jgi:lysine decarboxylase/arginine decarboxylase